MSSVSATNDNKTKIPHRSRPSQKDLNEKQEHEDHYELVDLSRQPCYSDGARYMKAEKDATRERTNHHNEDIETDSLNEDPYEIVIDPYVNFEDVAGQSTLDKKETTTAGTPESTYQNMRETDQVPPAASKPD